MRQTMMMTIAGATVGILLGVLLFLSADFAHTKIAAAPSPQISVATFWENAFFARREAGLPVKLSIPKIKVDANIERVGLTASGSMDVPKAWENAGWYEPGARPGEKGNAVIAGHLDSETGMAVFWRLRELKPRDIVEVTDEAGIVRSFVVKEVRTFKDDDAPIHEIFGGNDARRLNLITCGGTWNAKTGHYESRTVVFTEMIDSHPE